MKQHTKPCAECPFRRDIKPGFLGGSPVEAYIGQTILPFLLPCHCAKGYDQKRKELGVPQCVGTAIFRANLGVAWLMPDSLLKMPPNTHLVFGSMAQFVAHHKGVTLAEAREFIGGDKIHQCIMKERLDPGVKVIEGIKP